MAIDPLKADHPEFLTNYSPQKPNIIIIELSTLPEEEKKRKNYSYYVGLKLKSARIKFIKRRLNEILGFFKGRLLDHLLWEESFVVDGDF